MDTRWTSIPEAARERWRQTFSIPGTGVDLNDPCPVCGERQLHRYYQVGPRLPVTAPLSQFVARGALWEWCSNCRSYEHATALVPGWWQPDIVVDEGALTALPDALEAALARRPLPGRRVEVVELWTSDEITEKLLARLVLTGDGVVTTVARSAHHRKVVDETVARVPGPNGTWVTREAGHAFLELLASNLRGGHLYATQVVEMDEAAALRLPVDVEH